jgi:aminopeptidase N
VIRYQHSGADEMFDAHTYQKGGQILYMLRSLVGEEQFFEALKRYLTDNAYTDVEIDELRMAFEDVTGQDLHWFFDQWYLGSGHPELVLYHQSLPGKYRLRVQQVQEGEGSRVFRLPIALDFFVGGKHQIVNVWTESADTTFEFVANTAPTYVAFDPGHRLLCEIKSENRNEASWIAQLHAAENYADKNYALGQLRMDNLSDDAFAAVIALAKDPFWGTRQRVMQLLGQPGDHLVATAKVALELLKDPSAHVRDAALSLLEMNANAIEEDAPDLVKPLLAAFRVGVNDSSYAVSSASLNALYEYDTNEGLQMAEALIPQRPAHLLTSIGDILKETKSEQAFPFVQALVNDPRTETGTKSRLVNGLGALLNSRPAEEQRLGTDMLVNLATNEVVWWMRYSALQALSEVTRTPEITSFFESRLKAETQGVIVKTLKKYLSEK